MKNSYSLIGSLCWSLQCLSWDYSWISLTSMYLVLILHPKPRKRKPSLAGSWMYVVGSFLNSSLLAYLINVLATMGPFNLIKSRYNGTILNIIDFVCRTPNFHLGSFEKKCFTLFRASLLYLLWNERLTVIHSDKNTYFYHVMLTW